MSGTHRCCLGLLSISRVHTDGTHPAKVTRWCATDLLNDRGFDLARGYRFRVVASWRVILSAIHNASAAIVVDCSANSSLVNRTAPSGRIISLELPATVSRAVSDSVATFSGIFERETTRTIRGARSIDPGSIIRKLVSDDEWTWRLFDRIRDVTYR